MRDCMTWLQAGLDCTPPDRVAIRTSDAELTYGGLAEEAQGLGEAIRQRVGVGQAIHLVFDRCDPLCVVALLACWAAGCVPLLSDAALRPTTLEQRRSALGAVVELRAGYDADRIAGHAVRVLDLSPEITWSARLSSRGWEKEADNVGYAVSTSGTSGTPKISINLGAALAGTITTLADRYLIDGASRIMQFASCSYDAYYSEVLAALYHGAQLVMPRQGGWVSFPQLAADLTASSSTHVTVPPTAWRQLLLNDLGLRVAISAGEALDVKTARQLIARCDYVSNSYGPSETAICVATQECAALSPSGSADDLITLRNPLPGVSFQVRDEDGQLLSGGEGLLRIEGGQVGLGYLDEPERSVDAFGRSAGGSRTFQTEDWVQLEANGSFVFRYRVGRRVKRAGRFVDLDGIERVVNQLGSVTHATVDIEGDAVVCRYMGSDPTTVAAEAATELEIWERPNRFEKVSGIQMSAGGKAVRRVPTPRQAVPATAPASSPPTVAPKTDLTTLAGIWEGVVGGSLSGAIAFFSDGGDSLRAMQLIEQVNEEFDADVDLYEFLADPSFDRLCKLLVGTT